MRQMEAVDKLWAAFIALDEYIARGLQGQVSSSSAFGGEDMAPAFAAYRALRETGPFLPPKLRIAADDLLKTAERELNGYLEVLRRAIAMPKQELSAAKLMVHLRNEEALRVYRAGLDVVKAQMPVEDAAGAMDSSRLAHELKALLVELRKCPQDDEQQSALVNVQRAEVAAQRGDTERALKHLSATGKWALDAATKIGVEVATKAIQVALGLR